MKPILSLALAVLFITLTNCKTKNYDSLNMVIGTYNSSADSSDGIFVYKFNTLTGDFVFKTKVRGPDFPTYQAISKDGKFVYSVNQVREEGSVSSYRLNPETGELTFLNRVISGGKGATFISVDDLNNYAYVANFDNGRLTVVSINNDGSFGSCVQTFQDEGSSIGGRRQMGPHVHSAVLSPDNKILLSADLGIDKMNIYNADASNPSQPLSPADQAFVSVIPGNGPRHSTFHPNSKYAYLLTEMGGMVYVYDIDNGKLTEKQTITILPPDFKGNVSAADIHTSPDGKFLYCSNRGDANEIIIFSIESDGKLNLVGHQSTLGKKPRNFGIDPTGNWLLVGNEDSNEVVIFKRDKNTGLLYPTDKKIQVTRPNCIKFSQVN